MKVIPFPKPNFIKLTSDKILHTIDHLITRDFMFTCHVCSEQISFKTEKMLFKKMEFYCTKCGTKHKVTNPAFTQN